MKNEKERAGCKILWQTPLKMKSSLSKPTKTILKLYKLFTVDFPKELIRLGFASFWSMQLFKL